MSTGGVPAAGGLYVAGREDRFFEQPMKYQSTSTKETIASLWQKITMK
jgi:hypothetical protein